MVTNWTTHGFNCLPNFINKLVYIWAAIVKHSIMLKQLKSKIFCTIYHSVPVTPYTEIITSIDEYCEARGNNGYNKWYMHNI